MRTADEILEYIDSLVNAMLQRPKMFASSPEAFEDMLMTPDDLRSFIVSDADLGIAMTSRYV